MKLGFRCLFSLLVFIVVLFANSLEVNAMNTGFQTNQLPDEEKNTFVSNMNIVRLDEEPVKETITCFDVNSDRFIAIGQSSFDKKTICVYSDDGVFQYGYTFDCSGDFGVEWDEANLNIYFVRSSVIISVTASGEILDAVEVQNTIENNSYVNHFFHSTQRTIGDDEFLIRNDMGILNVFATSYSQLVVKDSTGVESIIYDVGSAQLFNMIVTIAIVFAFVSVAIVVLVLQFIKSRKGN